MLFSSFYYCLCLLTAQKKVHGKWLRVSSTASADLAADNRGYQARDNINNVPADRPHRLHPPRHQGDGAM